VRVLNDQRSVMQTHGSGRDRESQPDSADVSQTPPVLSIGDLNFTLDQIKRVVRPLVGIGL